MVDINLLLQQFPDLQEMLKKLPLELYKNSSLKAFSPGETIVERDAPVKYVYLLLRGEANVYSITYDGKLSIWMRTPAPIFISD